MRDMSGWKYDANFMVSSIHKNLWLKTFYLSLTRTTVSTIKVSFLVSKFQINVGSSLISAFPVLKLLGIEFDRNFATTPSLKKLATAANTRASMIYRLGFSMPPHLLTTLANGLTYGKNIGHLSCLYSDQT